LCSTVATGGRIPQPSFAIWALMARFDESELDAVVVRDGKNLKGRAPDAIVGSIGKGHLSKALDNTVKAVEARTRQINAH